MTIIKPTGVPGTGLGLGVLNPGAIVGIWGQNTPTYGETMGRLREGKLEPEEMDADNVKYAALNPSYIADAVITAIDTPWGVALGDVTVRAVGDGYIL